MVESSVPNLVKGNPTSFIEMKIYSRKSIPKQYFQEAIEL